MIKSWKLKWVRSLLNEEGFKKSKGEILSNPSAFWYALVLKSLPIFKSSIVKLKFKTGGEVVIRDFMSLYIFKEIFIDKCYDIHLNTDQPNIIDIGSNTGMFIIRMKQRYPQSFINGYEPMDDNFQLLNANLEANKFTKWKLYKNGVGKNCRTEKLYVHSKNVGGHSIYQNQTDGDNFIEINLVDIDQLLKNLNQSQCDLLKMDCEGAEFEIIKSITKEQASRIKKIIYEPTPNLYEPEELNMHLESIGYQFADQTSSGLFVATYQ